MNNLSQFPDEIIWKIAEYLEWHKQPLLRRVSCSFNNAITYQENYWLKLRQKYKKTPSLSPESHIGPVLLDRCYQLKMKDFYHPFYSEITLNPHHENSEKLLISWKGQCRHTNHYSVSHCLPPAPRGQYHAFIREMKEKYQWKPEYISQINSLPDQIKSLEKGLQSLRNRFEYLQMCRNFNK